MKLAGVSLLVALVVAAAGCGGSSRSGSTTSAAEQKANWADGMCSALFNWENNVRAAGQKVSTGNVSKSSIQDALSGISDANKKMRDDLDNLGRPPTPAADEARTALKHLSQDISENMNKIRDALSGGQGVTAAASAATEAAQAMGRDVQSAQGKLQSLSQEGSWQQAFSSSASCKKLSG